MIQHDAKVEEAPARKVDDL